MVNDMTELDKKVEKCFEQIVTLIDDYDSGIKDHGLTAAKKRMKNLVTKEVLSVVDELEDTMRVIHGGGNWKRIFLSFVSDVKNKYR